MAHNRPNITGDSSGRVYVKVFWLTSIILSVLLTVILNLVFHLFS